MRSLRLLPIPAPQIGTNQVQQVVRGFTVAPFIIEEQSVCAESFFASAGIPVSISAPSTNDYPDAIKVAKERIAELDRELKEQIFKFQNLKALQEEERRYLAVLPIHLQMADKGFPVSINMSFLKQVNPLTGMPTFAVINLHNPIFRLEGKVNFFGNGFRSFRFPRFLPSDLHAYYQEHLDRILRDELYPPVRGGTPSRIAIETQYAGRLPDNLKHLVSRALSLNIFSDILIVFEAFDWGVTSVPRKVDPLVIARSVHGSIFGPRWVHYSLAGVYDPTTGEEEVVSKYSRSS